MAPRPPSCRWVQSQAGLPFKMSERLPGFSEILVMIWKALCPLAGPGGQGSSGAPGASVDSACGSAASSPSCESGCFGDGELKTGDAAFSLLGGWIVRFCVSFPYADIFILMRKYQAQVGLFILKKCLRDA